MYTRLPFTFVGNLFKVSQKDTFSYVNIPLKAYSQKIFPEFNFLHEFLEILYSRTCLV